MRTAGVIVAAIALAATLAACSSSEPETADTATATVEPEAETTTPEVVEPAEDDPVADIPDAPNIDTGGFVDQYRSITGDTDTPDGQVSGIAVGLCDEMEANGVGPALDQGEAALGDRDGAALLLFAAAKNLCPQHYDAVMEQIQS